MGELANVRKDDKDGCNVSSHAGSGSAGAGINWPLAGKSVVFLLSISLGLILSILFTVLLQYIPHNTITTVLPDTRYRALPTRQNY
jgi:hypothetical protein